MLRTANIFSFIWTDFQADIGSSNQISYKGSNSTAFRRTDNTSIKSAYFPTNARSN
jgi:hypothetical protein